MSDTDENDKANKKEPCWVNIAILDVDGDRQFCLLGVYKEKWKSERDQKLAETYGGYPIVLSIEQGLF